MDATNTRKGIAGALGDERIRKENNLKKRVTVTSKSQLHPTAKAEKSNGIKRRLTQAAKKIHHKRNM